MPNIECNSDTSTTKSNIILINFSSRVEKGNSYSISQYIKEKLNIYNKNITVKQFNFYNLNVNKCGVCDYQCFKNTNDCPVLKDDIKSIYEEIINSNLCIYIIPIYSDYPCSNFFLFRERSQCIFSNENIYEQYLKVNKRFIIIGNTGIEQTMMILKNDFKDTFSSNLITNVKSIDVGEKSTRGNLITYNKISEQVDYLLKDIFKVLENK
ncbi:MAG: hypothetical protein K0Q49_242 [Haloplasmataceae bacterium]|jgi:multimeric flavodoxin WrbA|nr:hypothetical protein [Haloplasmataceae bacterium]